MAAQEVRLTSFDGLTLFARDYAPDPAGGKVHDLPVICLPGLTRNSLDFEDFAPRLAAMGRRVLCVDFRGRGRSSFDPSWAQNYTPPTYARDVLDVMAALGLHRAVFVGTSLGGIVSMVLASMRPTALAGVVLNDIGPRIEAAGLARIAQNPGSDAAVADWPAAVAYLRRANAGALPGLDEAGWLRFARRQFVERADGRLRPNYDPHISDALRQTAGTPPNLWALFQALLPLPTLVVRGALSDFLSEEGVAAMRAAKPDLATVTVPGIGHTPSLTEPEAMDAIRIFLAGIT